jgi:homoserine O-acetyltransferase
VTDLQVYVLGDVELQSGQILLDARLAYKTWGSLNSAADNVVVLPTFYTGTHERNEGFFGPGRAVDPERHFLVSINLFGNGVSSSPSNAVTSCAGPRFPKVTFYDNIKCQHRLLKRELDVSRIALVYGWSMAACQSYQWAAQYPDMVEAIVPFCGSARTSPHNKVFLEGVKAALQADQTFNEGYYTSPPERGLKAFGRVYAGWAYSQAFYRNGLYKQLGFGTFEELLVDWENDHLGWDANDLLAMLWTWQNGDISDNPIYGGNFAKALGAIKARTIVIPCSDDLYFPPEDNAQEVEFIANSELRVYQSPWGHCVASPGNDPQFQVFLDQAINEVMD